MVCASDNDVSYPKTYSVITDNKRGAAFVLHGPYAVTCYHIICDSKNVYVGGAAASVLAACPGDVAILHVPALLGSHKEESRSHDSHLFRDDISFRLNVRPNIPVKIRSPAGISVAGRLQDIQCIIYSISGASLPSLRIVDSRPFCSVSQGWSGSPVLCARTNRVVGMLAHGNPGDVTNSSQSQAYKELHAVPAALLQWFWNKFCRASVSRPGSAAMEWYGIGVIEMLRVRPLHEPGKDCRKLKRSLLAHKMSDRSPCGSLTDVRRGVRVMKVASYSGLLAGDVILKMNGKTIDRKGLIKWSGGMLTSIQAAFIGKEPGDFMDIDVVRKQGDKGTRLLKVKTRLGNAERGPLCLTVRARHAAVDAGLGTVRLAEISVEGLLNWYGSDWLARHIEELDVAVLGNKLANETGQWREYVAVDVAHCESISYQSAEPSGAAKFWCQKKGQVILTANGMDVGRLEDIIEASKLGDVLIQMQNGCTAVLPRPITLIENAL